MSLRIFFWNVTLPCDDISATQNQLAPTRNPAQCGTVTKLLYQIPMAAMINHLNKNSHREIIGYLDIIPRNDECLCKNLSILKREREKHKQTKVLVTHKSFFLQSIQSWMIKSRLIMLTTSALSVCCYPDLSKSAKTMSNNLKWSWNQLYARSNPQQTWSWNITKFVITKFVITNCLSEKFIVTFIMIEMFSFNCYLQNKGHGNILYILLFAINNQNNGHYCLPRFLILFLIANARSGITKAILKAQKLQKQFSKCLLKPKNYEKQTIQL